MFILSLICACKELCSSRFLAENDEVEDDEEELIRNHSYITQSLVGGRPEGVRKLQLLLIFGA